jgi:hypothetical protein
MKKFILLISIILVYSGSQAQVVFSLKNIPANKIIPRKEGGSLINIDIRNSMPMAMVMTVKYVLYGKNMDALVNTDLEQFSNGLLYDTIQFGNNDSIRRFSFKPVLDGFSEGNDTFVFKISQPSMGTIGSPDSVLIVITDSVAAPITGRPLYNIGTVRGANKNGIPDSVNKSCSIRGVLYGINRRAANLGYQMFICDATGCIGIFSGKTYAIYPTAVEGDSVEISGIIEHFRGLGQIKFNATGDTIRKLGFSNVKSPQLVTALNEASEAKLVKLDGLTLSSGNWLADSAFELKMKNSANLEFSIRIENKPSTNFSAPAVITSGKTYSITGMGTQFDQTTGTTYTMGYQILPRKLSDIVSTGSSISSVSALNFTVFPTLVTNTMHVYMDAAINESVSIQVIDLLGKVVREDRTKLNIGENIFQLSQLDVLPQGNYILNIQTSNNQLRKQFSIVK